MQAAVDVKALGHVAVLMGGFSSEREVSLSSGEGVLKGLLSKGVNAEGFDPARRSITELAAGGFDRVFIALHGRFGEDGAGGARVSRHSLYGTGREGKCRCDG